MKIKVIFACIAYFASFVFSLSSANEVNIFSARHYDSDVQLYEKFTNKTGIKVNVISGKSGALEKRIIEEGSDSKADLYITADAGRLGAFEAKGMLQSGLNTSCYKSSCTKQFQDF
jgi:iron(III) transport system substrate-binding protein